MTDLLDLNIALPSDVVRVTQTRYFHDLWLPIQVARRDPQPVFPLHNHDFDEIAFIVRGHGVNFMNGVFHLVLPGNVIYLRAEDTHAYPMVSNLRLLNIFFDHTRVVENFPKLHSLVEDFHQLQASHSVLFSDYPAYARLRGLTAQLDMETMHSDSYTEYSAMAYLVEFLVLVLRQYQSREQYDPDKQEDAMRSRMLRLLADPSLPDMFSRADLETLVENYGLSWRSFERSLSELTDLSPHHLCVCNRFLRFLNLLLKDPNIPLEETAYAAGFTDYRSMSRNCQTFMGISPKQVREKVRHYVTTPPIVEPA